MKTKTNYIIDPQKAENKISLSGAIVGILIMLFLGLALSALVVPAAASAEAVGTETGEAFYYEFKNGLTFTLFFENSVKVPAAAVGDVESLVINSGSETYTFFQYGLNSMHKNARAYVNSSDKTYANPVVYKNESGTKVISMFLIGNYYYFGENSEYVDFGATNVDNILLSRSSATGGEQLLSTVPAIRGGAFVYDYGVQGGTATPKTYAQSIKFLMADVPDITNLKIYDNLSGKTFIFLRIGTASRDGERAYNTTDSTTAQAIVYANVLNQSDIIRVHQIGDYWYLPTADENGTTLFNFSSGYYPSENFPENVETIPFTTQFGTVKHQTVGRFGSGGSTKNYNSYIKIDKSNISDLSKVILFTEKTITFAGKLYEHSEFVFFEEVNSYFSAETLTIDGIAHDIRSKAFLTTNQELLDEQYADGFYDSSVLLYVFEIENYYYILGAQTSGINHFDINAGAVYYEELIYTLPETPTRTGYTFGGWYYDDELSDPFIEGDIITGDTEFFAKWDAINYNITYFLTNGQNAASNVASYTIANALTFADASKTGYTFRGWYNSARFDGEPITSLPAGTYGDIELYAKFDIIMCKVTFFVSNQVYATMDVEYGSALVNADGQPTAAAAEISSVDFAALLSAYGLEALSSITGDTELSAVVLSGLAKWNALGLWFIDNWIWIVVGIAVLVAAVVVVIVVWKRN